MSEDSKVVTYKELQGVYVVFITARSSDTFLENNIM